VDSAEGYKAEVDALRGINLIRSVDQGRVVYQRPEGNWIKL